MEKNSNLHYVLTSHVAERGSDGQYYCRALQTVMVGAYCYCTSCPLFGGFSQFGNMEEEPECWYYDMEEMQEEKQTVTFLSCLAETNYGYKKIHHYGRREDEAVE